MFADPRVDVGKDGQARVAVNVAGDEVVSAGRYVHVPEAWQRAEREREGRATSQAGASGARRSPRSRRSSPRCCVDAGHATAARCSG